MKIFWLILFVLIDESLSTCERKPDEKVSVASKTPGDHGFKIQINGDPEKYIPGSHYVISIVGSRQETGLLERFRSFTLTVEATNTHDLSRDLSFDSETPRRLGHFMLYTDQLTDYHGECINTVKELNSDEKVEVQVMWSAPQNGSGCVTFKAMVLVNQDTWYADDGLLSKKLCEISTDVRDVQTRGSDVDECCSCDEAKYKMVFEGLWSSSTHPKDYPTNLWLTHFSDIIGGSHTRNFTIWSEGTVASDGLRQVAEWGSVGRMEAELRAKSKNLRTLVKVAGLWHPHVNSNTSGTFRVDPKKNLLSVVSMFGPSPDWIVGVSNLNLCLRDCTWIEEKIIDLYPYDAGTDSGITYMSPNEPTTPPERVHRITTMYPEDPRSPFYDPFGEDMKPLARLYLNREKVVAKSCGEVTDEVELPQVELTENTGDTRRPECNVTEYTNWSPCSVTCGKGIRMRQRQYVMPQKASMLGCDRQLVSKEMCVADLPTCSGALSHQPHGLLTDKPNQLPDSDEQLEDYEDICKTSEYGEWSECSTTCGVGVTMRNRRFIDRWGRKKCPHVKLVERKECVMPPCPPPSPGINMDERCIVTEWTDWSPCTVTCGTGLRHRTRAVTVSGDLKDICAGRVELQQQRMCTIHADCSVGLDAAKEVCMMEPDVGPCRGYFQRWHFDPREKRCVDFAYGGCRGNRNNFKTENECTQACQRVGDQLDRYTYQESQTSNQVDCVMTKWSDWSPCSVSCGVGKSSRVRMVKTPPSAGGKSCPKRLIKRKVCSGPPCDQVQTSSRMTLSK